MLSGVERNRANASALAFVVATNREPNLPATARAFNLVAILWIGSDMIDKVFNVLIGHSGCQGGLTEGFEFRDRVHALISM